MYHNVYARVAVLAEHDEDDTLRDRIYDKIVDELEPSELEVELLGDSGDNPGCVEVEIDCLSPLNARVIHARIETIFASFDPLDSIIGVN